MSKAVMQRVLDVLVRVNASPHLQDFHHAFDEEITALKQALAEPEPKPVAWMCPDDPDRATAFAWRYGYCIDCGKPRIPLYIGHTGETK